MIGDGWMVGWLGGDDAAAGERYVNIGTPARLSPNIPAQTLSLLYSTHRRSTKDGGIKCRPQLGGLPMSHHMSYFVLSLGRGFPSLPRDFFTPWPRIRDSIV